MSLFGRFLVDGQRWPFVISGASVEHEPAFVDRVGDHSAHQMAGPYGVVVTGDQVLDQVRVAVGVNHGDDGDPELVGLGDRNVFADGVDHKDGVR